MNERDPSTFDLITYAWVIFLSGLGGLVAFLRKIKEGHARAFNLLEFVGEIVTSAFTGIITFYLCESAHVDRLLTAALIGVSGHMGSRALFLIENYLSKKIK
jgi:NhaP-type Na+/H+ and K+/H+ antiporter